MVKNKFTVEKLKVVLKQFQEESKLYEYRTKDYSFEMIYSKYGDGDDKKVTLFVPAYQRGFIWKPDRQSKFIESVLLGVPLTPFLVSEEDDEYRRLEIIDGSQRIRTLIAFYDNKLKLRGLNKLTYLCGAKYKDLPKKLQSYLWNRDFRIIVVDNADENIRQDLFQRINTTSEDLTDAEVRKGSFSGGFYNLILELKGNKDFEEICPVSKGKSERGEKEELLLRFFAYIDKYSEFKHDVAIFLNDYLEEMNNNFDKKQYKKSFLLMVKFIKNNFPIGFRKEQNSKSTPRVRFEAIAVGTYLALQENPDLEKPSLDWLYSKGFKIQTTSDASNNPDRLKNRIEFVRDGLLGKLDKDRLQNG